MKYAETSLKTKEGIMLWKCVLLTYRRARMLLVWSEGHASQRQYNGRPLSSQETKAMLSKLTSIAIQTSANSNYDWQREKSLLRWLLWRNRLSIFPYKSFKKIFKAFKPNTLESQVTSLLRILTPFLNIFLKLICLFRDLFTARRLNTTNTC